MTDDTTGYSSIEVRINPRILTLIPRYLDNQRAELEKVRLALAEGDYRTISVIGHGMKGSGGGYGFARITQLGAELEEAGKAEDSERIRVTADRLQDYLERVVVVSS